MQVKLLRTLVYDRSHHYITFLFVFNLKVHIQASGQGIEPEKCCKLSQEITMDQLLVMELADVEALSTKMDSELEDMQRKLHVYEGMKQKKIQFNKLLRQCQQANKEMQKVNLETHIIRTGRCTLFST